MDRQISIRSLALVLVLALVAVSCGDGTEEEEAGEGRLVALASGGTFGRGLNAAFFLPFQRETGITVELVEGPDDPIPQVKAQVESGNVQWDVVGCTIKQALQEPIWEPIDYSIVESTDGLVTEEAAGEVYITQVMTAFPILAYNTEAHTTAPTSWADYFDTANFPGPRGAPNFGLDSAWAMPAIALLADGVSPEELVPFDLDRAYEKLETLKPDIRVFWSTFSQGQDLIRSGEMTMSPLIDGRTLQLIDQAQPVGIVWNQGFIQHGAFCTPKGSPNKETAMRFYEWLLTNGEAQGTFTSITFYGPPTEVGIEAAQRIGVSDSTSQHVDVLIPETTELLTYVQENDDELLNRWNAFVGA
jgi:spermidine/putrescine-binding protein